MNPIFKNVLFSKHILVEDGQGENQLEAMIAMLDKLGIKITSGFEMANLNVMRYAAGALGEYVPTPFYRGFPESVRELTPDQLLFDQMVHYTKTYGFGDFSEAGHSIMEKVAESREFAEETPIKEFVILSEDDAKAELVKLLDAMLESTRPLNGDQMENIKLAIAELSYVPKNIASKQVAVELLYATKNTMFARYLTVPDVVKLIEHIQYSQYGSEHINKLHLKNADRKFITKIINILANRFDDREISNIAEKRDAWKGLLHHIHYKPVSTGAKALVKVVYDETFKSAYSKFEADMKENPVRAAAGLKARKGNGALLRNLNYILSRTCDVTGVTNLIEAKNPLIIIQMMNMYRNYSDAPRTFRFVKNNRVRVHKELTRKYTVSPWDTSRINGRLEYKLYESLHGKAGRVYIADGMEKIAVPMNMSAGQSGFGIMPTGSRFAIPEGKKVRAFTYWEKVNDIDLACFGLDDKLNQTEFSWRTMYRNQSDAITYSGDETSGFYGGSEYFDIDIDAIRKQHPKMKYLVFTNNVYSAEPFKNVVCRAGWMSRDVLDSGEIYEPKTVESSYTINADSTFAYLFALDLEAREFIWLNIADSRNLRVAGTAEFDWLVPYFTMCETMNMAKLFYYAATEVVKTPEEADLVIGDIETDKPQVKSWEFEKAFAYLK